MSLKAVPSTIFSLREYEHTSKIAMQSANPIASTAVIASEMHNAGLPPHDDCIFRLMQIALDGDRPSRKHEYLYPAVWPSAGRRYEIGRY